MTKLTLDFSHDCDAASHITKMVGALIDVDYIVNTGKGDFPFGNIEDVYDAIFRQLGDYGIDAYKYADFRGDLVTCEGEPFEQGTSSFEFNGNNLVSKMKLSVEWQRKTGNPVLSVLLIPFKKRPGYDFRKMADSIKCDSLMTVRPAKDNVLVWVSMYYNIPSPNFAVTDVVAIDDYTTLYLFERTDGTGKSALLYHAPWQYPVILMDRDGKRGKERNNTEKSEENLFNLIGLPDHTCDRPESADDDLAAWDWDSIF